MLLPRIRESLVAVIIAGGIGSRFWPLSTRERPKQFVSLFGGRSMLQATYDRMVGLVPPERTLVLTNKAFVPLVQEQLPAIPSSNILGEPMRRDTAGAVVLAALLCRRRFSDAVMVVLPADHVIFPAKKFREALLSAAAGTQKDNALYTFGIAPQYPATGYGYLEYGDPVTNINGMSHYRLVSFREKPDAQTAYAYFTGGKHLWNSGMFVWTTNAILTEIESHLPAHVASLGPLMEYDGTADWDEALHKAFARIPSISIDYGVMEKAANVRTIIAPFNWSDVGGWPALEPFLDKDPADNAHRGRIKVLDAGSNIVYCEDDKETVVLIGVDDLIIVRSGGKTLICSRSRSEDLKKLVEGFSG